jgi:poly(3-hydroxybutyrate) depolymerase/lysophospholipase L1-like esterase
MTKLIINLTLTRLAASLCILILTACGGSSGPESQLEAQSQTSEAPATSTVPSESSVTQTIDGQLVDRPYLIRYPADLSQDSYPVVFFFHGAGGNGEGWLSGNPEVAALIDAGEFIGVFPDGYQQRWNSGNETSADDVEFVSLIVNDLASSSLFNTDKLYGVGTSNGAGMVNKIAKETSFFKGIAPIISQQTTAIGSLVPPQSVSVFQVNGSADGLVPLGGGLGVAGNIFMSAQGSAENWASNFNCNMTPDSRSKVWGDQAVEEYTFNGCLNNKKVRYLIVDGAGHTTSFGDDINLYGLIWTFFKSTDRQSALDIKLLSLGDSYTIGQSVCASCSFPEQLKDSLLYEYSDRDTVALEVIAQTGWTTTNLKAAIADENPSSDFDLVTLLIGVNNQYQSKPFDLYETEFIELVDSAISFVGDDPAKLIVVSIPDYAFTPFGQNYNQEEISGELEVYNDFAEQYCADNGLSYVYITDITQQGITSPELVASDRLHPSALAYSRFVERILPVALEKLQ